MFKVCCHSVYISQKSCFSLWTKNNPLKCRCNFSSLYSEKMCIIRQPVNFFTKNDNSLKFSQNFSQISSQTVKDFVKFLVKFSVSLQRKSTRASSFYHCFTILRSRRCGIIFTRFHAFT